MKTNAVIHEKHGEPLFLDGITIQDPKPEEVIVQLFAGGICGSQLTNLTNPRTAVPELLGHEGTGMIIKKGKNVTHVEEGDHVLISWMPYGADEKTEYLQWGEVGWRDQKIKTLIYTWAEHANMHAQFVSKIDKDFEKYTSSVIGCAGIAGYGTVMNTVKVQKGQSVVVYGAGGLGNLAINAARNHGANPIIAVDLNDEKLKFAKEFGATYTINSKKCNALEEIRKITNGGADFVFDMVGIPSLTEETILAAKEGIPGYSEGGTTVITGFPKGPVELNPRMFLMGQRTYKGSRGGACVPARDFPLFYNLYKEGKFQLDEIVTERYKLEQINEAIERLKEGKILGRAILEIS